MTSRDRIKQQGASFFSDALLHHPDLLGNVAASSIPVVGIILATSGVFRRSVPKA
jgi:hypothetical protein